MTRKIVLGFGMLAAATYVSAVWFGGRATPGYDALAQPVSDLIALEAPAKSLLDPLFLLYNALVLAFALQVARDNRHEPRNGLSRLGFLGAVALCVEAVAGILTQLFPEGAAGANSRVDWQGAMHITFASISSITSIAAMYLLGRWSGEALSRPWLRRYSLVLLCVTVATGLLAGVLVAKRHALGGLAERLTIGSFLLWLATVSAVMVFTAREAGGRP